ncbi:hypothetical protein ARTHRO9V_280076 [Arthrobacter sp. 9V]|nr:hypothetical protein ARTHRO9V_280076 [Arthrobacter sp. 9V]
MEYAGREEREIENFNRQIQQNGAELQPRDRITTYLPERPRTFLGNCRRQDGELKRRLGQAEC